MKLKKIGLIWRILIAIAAGALAGLVFPDWLTRIFVTVNGIFSNFLNFAVPLIILGLVAPGIAELGKSAGRILVVTVAIAYGSSVFSGFFTYGACLWTYPRILDHGSGVSAIDQTVALQPYINIEIPPVLNVMSALVLAFILGIILINIKGNTLKNGLMELREVVNALISSVIFPLLPFYIFGIFLNMSASGQVAGVMSVFLKIIVVILILHVVLLVLYFCVAALIAGGNPFRYLRNMMPAYVTALGTQSSAATIPVTLECAVKNGVSREVAGFLVPLTATVHLCGSMMKIIACSMAIMVMTGMDFEPSVMTPFIFVLAITMIAAPGVPSGAIMTAIGILTSMLGFDQTQIGLIIAIYVVLDSFGTACNVTADGAIALIINKIYSGKLTGKPEKHTPTVKTPRRRVSLE